MGTLLTLAVDCAWLAIWIGACALLGAACWVALAERERHGAALWPNPELALFFSIGTGLALHVLLLIALAVSQLLRPLPILLALGTLTACSAAFLVLRPARWKAIAASFHLPLSGWLQVLLVLLLILRWLLHPLAPPDGSDALTYHLPYARFYLEQGGLAVDQTLRFPLHTHNVNLLYATALIRPGATLAQLLHAAMGLLALLGVYGIARHWRGWPTALLAASGMLLLGEFRISFSTAYVDNGVVLYLTAAFLALALWSEGGPRQLLWWAALFAGTAMGTKYFGALFTVPLGLMVLYFSRDLKLTARFALLVSVVGLFWYVRSWLISGNPVHPFAGGLFGYYGWTPDELSLQMRELRQHGVDKTWPNFLLLPLKLFSEWRSFSDSPGQGGILIAAFMSSCLLIRWQRPAVRVLQLTCLAWLLFWFWSSQVIRYLMLVTPLMSLAAAMAWMGLADRLRRVPSAQASLKPLLAFVVAFAGYCFYAIERDLSRFPLFEKPREDYVLRTQPSYELALAAAADARIGTGPVMQFMLPEFRYFYTGTVYGDWMGEHAYHRYGHARPSADWEIDESATLHGKVVAAGIRAVVMNKGPVIQFSPQEIPTYREHFDFVLETDRAVLMIPKPPVERGPGLSARSGSSP